MNTGIFFVNIFHFKAKAFKTSFPGLSCLKIHVTRNFVLILFLQVEDLQVSFFIKVDKKVICVLAQYHRSAAYLRLDSFDVSFSAIEHARNFNCFCTYQNVSSSDQITYQIWVS